MSAAQNVLASPELVDKICSQLFIDHICNLRSASRSLEASTWHAFKRRGFSAKSFAFTKPGLERFLEITQYDRFARELTSVSFCAFRQSFRLTVREKEEWKAKLTARGTFYRAEFEDDCMSVEQVRAEHHTTDMESLLKRAFSNLARLGTKLEVFVWAEGSEEDGAQSSRDRAFDYAQGRTMNVRFHRELPEASYSVGINDALVAVLHAVETTQAVVTRVHAPECVVPDEIMSNNSWWPDTTTFFCNLSSLGLAMAPSRCRNMFTHTNKWARFELFLARTKLRHLSLHLDDQTESHYIGGHDDLNRTFWDCRERFLANAICTGLEEVAFTERITNAYFEKEQISHLAPFIYNHSATLRKVVISMTYLQAPYGTDNDNIWIDTHASQAISAIGRALAACEHLESLRLERSGITRYLNDCDRVFPEGCCSRAWAGTMIPVEQGRRLRSRRIDVQLPIICYDKHSGIGELEEPTLSEFLQWMSEHTDNGDDGESVDSDSDDDDHDHDDDEEIYDDEEVDDEDYDHSIE